MFAQSISAARLFRHVIEYCSHIGSSPMRAVCLLVACWANYLEDNVRQHVKEDIKVVFRVNPDEGNSRGKYLNVLQPINT